MYSVVYYTTVRKDETVAFGTKMMGFEMVMLSRMSQKVKDKYRMVSLICGI